MPERELPHLPPTPHERACAQEPLKEVFGQRLTGLIVPGEERKGLLFPSPILHDLRGEFDEIPRDVDARHGSDRDGGGQVMKEMSELVEYGLHLGVSQEGTSPLGGDKFPAMTPTCGSNPPFWGPRVLRSFIQAPCLLSERGCQSA